MNTWMKFCMNSKIFTVIGLWLWLAAGALSLRATMLAFDVRAIADATAEQYVVLRSPVPSGHSASKPDRKLSSPLASARGQAF